jgi:hypothetical protein
MIPTAVPVSFPPGGLYHGRDPAEELIAILHDVNGILHRDPITIDEVDGPEVPLFYEFKSFDQWGHLQTEGGLRKPARYG